MEREQEEAYSFISSATSTPFHLVQVPKVTIADSTSLVDGGFKFFLNSYIMLSKLNQ